VPAVGSQVVLCDLPVRFDTYSGCAHGCTYCFVRARRRDLADVRPAESVAALRRWIAGHRTQETRWCDWRIPLHVGGLSDPLQPIEREQHRTLACLELLAAERYPFVLSTKSTLAVESPWLDVLSECVAAVQVSMVAPSFDRMEPGAPPFRARLAMLRRLVPRVRRVLVRIQPYVPAVRRAVLAVLPRYAAAGVHGVIVEGLKRKHAGAGLVKVGADWCFPADVLRRDLESIRARCHQLGLRFYSAENRLRCLSDDRCCCGIDGLSGFRPNRANLNTLVFGRPLRYRAAMRVAGSGLCFKALAQSPLSTVALKRLSFTDCMDMAARVPVYRAAMGLRSRG
jgi:DNA repair photolyase